MRGSFAALGERPAPAACVAVRKRSGCSVSSCATVLEPSEKPTMCARSSLSASSRRGTSSACCAAIGLRVARLVAPAGAARVERDDAEILLQVGDHAGRDPALEGRRAAVQQHDRLALAAVDVVDLHTAEVGVFAVLDRKRRRDRETQQRGRAADVEFHRQSPPSFSLQRQRLLTDDGHPASHILQIPASTLATRSRRRKTPSRASRRAQ